MIRFSVPSGGCDTIQPHVYVPGVDIGQHKNGSKARPGPALVA
jgi:hypothetical protein